jgi:Helix-turn-helix of DDE superfamily endonuclease
MAGLRFTDLQSRPMEFLDFTSLTLDEFQQLVPPFETAFQTRMAAWRMDGKPRTARRFTVYKNCPLLTPEDRLLFILVYLKTYVLQVVHGRLFGMVQGKANQWIHVLLPALLAALRALGDAPARSLSALAQRLGVSEADAATGVVPLEEEPAPVAPIPAAVPASPLLPMTGRNGASSAPKTRLNRKRVIAARKKTTPSKMSCSSMPCSSSSFSVTPMAAVPMISPLRTRRHIPCRRGAGCCRTWVSWRSRCPRWRSSCRRRSHAVGGCPWSKKGPTRRSTSGDYGLSTSTAVSSVAAL